MASINIPNLYSGSANPLNVASLNSVKPTDPRDYAITKTGSELGVDQYYFHTGDIAKLQSALFINDTSGNWNNPDFADGAQTPNPAYLQAIGVLGQCHAGGACTFGPLSCDPASPMYIGNFLAQYNGVQCFPNFSDLDAFIQDPIGLDIPKFLTSAGTAFITDNQSIVDIVNNIAGNSSLVKNNQDNFLYVNNNLDTVSDAFIKHLGFILDPLLGPAKMEIGIESSLSPFMDKSTGYTGLLSNHRKTMQLSGEAVLKTGNQFVSGSKTFHDATYIENTGYIRYPIFGSGHIYQDFKYPSGIGHSILGGAGNSILQDAESTFDTSSNVVWGTNNLINNLSGGAILGGTENSILNSDYGWIQNSRNSQIQNFSGNYLFPQKHDNKISQ